MSERSTSSRVEDSGGVKTIKKAFAGGCAVAAFIAPILLVVALFGRRS